jgi:Soluble lytic murein transglycosylase and related regulatory proteins (some contain LysM/invasin domains)
MITPQKFLFPAILFGSTILVLIAHFLTSPQIAVAATPMSPTAQPTVVAQSASACSLSLPTSISTWCIPIQEAAQNYGVSPQLISAVMLQESGGQADAISSSGAVGLLQVMPSDGIAASFQCGSGPCFASRPTTQQLLDPAFNIDYGVRMLASLTQKYGSEREALKAYGPYDVGYYYADKVLILKSNLASGAIS